MVTWVAPIIVATQLKITLKNNSQTTPDADANLSDVILRAIPKFQGINAIDTVKVIVAEGALMFDFMYDLMCNLMFDLMHH